MDTTLSKPIFRPLSANSMRSSSGRAGNGAAMSVFRATVDRRAAKARAFREAVFIWNCMKLALALGSVVLKSSNASSSFK
eukprot:CAMPEP_0179051226 /NCGR_PEP_ID=MMETSP0796-20121207/21137_1 /TAXON_ID=73915 /ORGANISM="Pyrodinium bahamense, Strain pbaha01" /LENGTH=79 /DNA_ID=CAMNT_0020747763 /DNA_START=21 /DNA_END=257 /DNA_ORIENTATION=-